VGLVSAYAGKAGSAVLPGASPPNFHVPASFIIYSLIFFLAGYFLYASIYAAMGAMVSSDDELQQLQFPVTVVLVACFVLYPIISRDPNSPLSIALTMIPFFSPILMVFRITIDTPPFWQIALSLALCAATTVGRPSFAELLRWLRYT
jgi:ABC-2 type transport system permease protein